MCLGLSVVTGGEEEEEDGWLHMAGMHLGKLTRRPACLVRGVGTLIRECLTTPLPGPRDQGLPEIGSVVTIRDLVLCGQGCPRTFSPKTLCQERTEAVSWVRIPRRR